MKYKVSDKVKIRSFEWYNTNKDKNGRICPNSSVMPFTKLMSNYCGQTATITRIIDKGRYKLDLPNQYFLWNDYMFEGNIHNYAYKATEDIQHNKKIIKYLELLGGINILKFNGSIDPNYYYFINNDTGYIDIDTADSIKNKSYILMEFKEQNTMEKGTIKISLETAKEWYKKGGELKEVALRAYTEKELKVLPETWEECILILKHGEFIGTESNIISQITESKEDIEIDKNVIPKGLGRPMLALCQLLICREVYRQGWKPDWQSLDTKYTIVHVDGIITTNSTIYTSNVLSFPTEKIRNEYLNNFRDLIEEAKELI